MPTPRRIAVQAVTLASAACSAAYYATQAPGHTVTVQGVEIAPWITAVALTAFALDATKPLMLAAALDTVASVPRRAVAGLVFAVLFLASMIAVDGMLMRWRSDWQATRARDVSAYTAAKAERERVAGELARLAGARTTSEVRADMDRARVPSRIWDSTRQCTDAELLRGPSTAAACKPILDLRQEMAQAIRKGDLERDLAGIRGRIASMEADAPPKSADPQAEALSRITGHDGTAVAYAMAALLGLALELVACFGTWIATSGNGADQTRDARATGLEPAGASAMRIGTCGTPVGTGAKPLALPAPSAEPDPVVEWIHQFRARHGRNPRIPQVMAEFRIPKTTAWRRLRSA